MAFTQMTKKISIHSPLAGRDHASHGCPWHTRHISIHSPLAGRDLEDLTPVPPSQVFQSTRPSRGETINPMWRIKAMTISIHSPLAGRAALIPPIRGWEGDFNPLAPRGARQQKVIKYFLLKPFLLHNTHPYRFKIGPIRRKMRYA